MGAEVAPDRRVVVLQLDKFVVAPVDTFVVGLLDTSEVAPEDSVVVDQLDTSEVAPEDTFVVVLSGRAAAARSPVPASEHLVFPAR